MTRAQLAETLTMLLVLPPRAGAIKIVEDEAFRKRFDVPDARSNHVAPADSKLQKPWAVRWAKS